MGQGQLAEARQRTMLDVDASEKRRERPEEPDGQERREEPHDGEGPEARSAEAAMLISRKRDLDDPWNPDHRGVCPAPEAFVTYDENLIGIQNGGRGIPGAF